jgi:hypothetical protein
MFNYPTHMDTYLISKHKGEILTFSTKDKQGYRELPRIIQTAKSTGIALFRKNSSESTNVVCAGSIPVRLLAR